MQSGQFLRDIPKMDLFIEHFKTLYNGCKKQKNLRKISLIDQFHLKPKAVIKRSLILL